MGTREREVINLILWQLDHGDHRLKWKVERRKRITVSAMYGLEINIVQTCQPLTR